MKKISFNDKYGHTEAVLSGRKTQKRQIIKMSPIDNQYAYEKNFPMRSGNIPKALIEAYSRYQIGEVVAVAQNYKDAGYDFCMSQAAYINKMFTKAEYMPHQIRITNVRVERLNDITEADCMAEGIEKVKESEGFYRIPISHKSGRITYMYGSSPRAVYAVLIDRICGNGTWESNPWAFVYDFELVK